ncbi:MAG: flagellar basal body rod protein FlgB [Defluviitaleaceae bacterium]|nr:flagellar basal body rod protein FlgB [Defluviitaleaceae bacterium]
MIFDSMLSHNKIIGAAMNAATVRSNVINNNIANADVPNFTKSTVVFEELLARELDGARRTGNVNLSNITPRVVSNMEGYSFRVDGNNVDIESEMVELYKNAARYDVMANSLMGNYRRINAVLQGMR